MTQKQTVEHREGSLSSQLPRCDLCSIEMVKSGRVIAELSKDSHAFDGWRCIKCRTGKSRAIPKVEPQVSIIIEKPQVTTEPVTAPIKISKVTKFQTKLIGMQNTAEEIIDLLNYGTKGIFIGGFHGLGKTSIVYELAEFYKAEVVRLQVTELLSEVDIVGGVDLKTGGFKFSQFVEKLLEAIAHPEKKYFILLDEFTRGREEALNILFPFLAEKVLFINSAYSEIKEIKLSSNVKVLGTGNVKDKGIRAIGEAEFDRWSGVEVKPLTAETDIKRLIAPYALELSIQSMLIRFYKLSWQYGDEMRIIPMSHRTLIEVANVANLKTKNGGHPAISLKSSLKGNYFVTSQAMMDANFSHTYDQMVREVF